MPRDPNIYVERCAKCPAYNYGTREVFGCGIGRRFRVVSIDRRFPRWCPLLKKPITVAAIRNKVK